MPPPSPTGALAWMGLAAADRTAAVEFYATAFEWEATDEADHTRLSRAGKDVALVYQQTPQARAANVTSHWSPFFRVPDADLALERAAGSGGASLREPFDVKGGRVAPLQDHAGAVFSIWAPCTPDALEPIPSDAWWIELSTPDVEASQMFYAELLGWTFDATSGGAGIRGPAGPIGAMRRVQARPSWSPFLLVTDAEEAARRAAAAGAVSVGAAEGAAIGRMVWIVDRQGAELALLEQPGRIGKRTS
jgi:predicted enzyme related to lactoylglutathione lyase